MPVLTAHHTTIYWYRKPVRFGTHFVMSRPQAWADQRLLEATLRVTPYPASVEWDRDPFGNWIEKVTFRSAATELRFDAIVKVDTAESHRLGLAGACATPAYSDAEQKEAAPWLGQSGKTAGDPVPDWAREITSSVSGNPLDLVKAVNRSIRRFRYMRRTEQGTQSAALTLALGSGSCRDLAMLMVEAVHALGFAARFVSGYIRVRTDGRNSSLGGGSTHAWTQVLLPGSGWIDFDPTNDIVGNRDLVRVAVTQRPEQAVPLSGSWSGLSSDSLGMTVTVAVTADATARPRSCATLFPPLLASEIGAG